MGSGKLKFGAAGRLVIALGIAVAAGYLFAVVTCHCGLLPFGTALDRVLPWQRFQFFVAVPFAIMAVELALVGWRRSSLAAILRWTPSIKVDAFYLVIQMWFARPLITLMTGGLFWQASHWASAHSLRLAISDDPLLQVLIVFVVTDFATYWVHRLSHAWPALWEAHKVHHSATDLNVMMTFRFHPLETMWLEVAGAALFLLLGASVDTFVVFSVINMVLIRIHHAPLDWTFGPLGKIVVSPAFHRFHHSRHRPDLDMNFGNQLVVWDMLFGTYTTRTLRPDEIGVDGNTYVEKPLLSEFFRPYYVLCTSIARSVGSLLRRRPAGVELEAQAAD